MVQLIKYHFQFIRVEPCTGNWCSVSRVTMTVCFVVVVIVVVVMVTICIMVVMVIIVMVSVVSMVPVVVIMSVIVVALVITVVIVVVVVSVTALVIVVVWAAEGGSVVVQLLLHIADLPLQELLQGAGVGSGCVSLALSEVRE